ncbi:hypothetical protein GCM10027405_05540 [Arthrobacter alkaliphilus]|uniref:hypothetical protein n=1 Tax=Arthrobacter alkaliphilus TaxID=369936 RepID=UPI001F21F7B4|nr:hypothetical protein [Arthrobacter alkaliphilus]
MTPSQATIQPAGPLSEFGITDAEYKAIVESYAIDANQYKTPEQVTAAFMERINKYYADGNSLDARTAHSSYKSRDGVYIGWNAWATDLYTKALMEGLYVSAAQEKGGLGEQYAANDVIVKSLWINSINAGEVPYKLTNSFAITDVVEKTASSFTVRGTQTVADNSAQVPSAARDSRKIGTKTFPNSRISFMLNSMNHRWIVAGEAGR